MCKADGAQLADSLLVLLDEIYEGPPDPRGTWVVSNRAGSGLLGTLKALTARQAGEGPAPTAAAHASHLVFALDLANRALKGEDCHAGADWSASWQVQQVEEEGWQELLGRLQDQYRQFREIIGTGLDWEDPLARTGVLAQLAHGSYHLGAARRIVRSLGIDME